MTVDDAIPGGGSGGGGTDDNTHKSTIGTYEITGNQVVLMSRVPLDPMATPRPNGITILACGNTLVDGKVDLRGSKGVRITAGPPAIPMVSPETTADSTNGVEIVVAEPQNITLQRGLIDGVDQKIEMQPASILVDGGVGTVTIQSLTEITLQVAGGVSKISLTPAGIIMQGPIIMIN